MGLFDKVGSFIKREAEDLEKAAERVRDKVDEELTEREAELEMTPAEKLRALQRKGRATSDKMDRIADKVEQQTAAAEAASGSEPPTTQAASPGPAATDESSLPPPPPPPPGESAQPPASGYEAPPITQIVLADGSVYSGADVVDETYEDETPTDVAAQAPQQPQAGDLAWLAPQPGEEAVVPKFNTAKTESEPAADPEAGGATDPIEGIETTEPGSAAADVPPPLPPEPVEPRNPEPESKPTLAEAGATGRPETPAEIAARVVAELEAAVDAAPEPETEPDPAPEPESTAYEKTPAQRKYEEARAAADKLLEELRGELRNEGEI